MLSVVHCQLAKDKMLQCNIQAAQSECGLNASFTSHMYLSYWMKSFHLFSLDGSASQWGEIRERGSAKMITFTSSSLLYLRRIQTLKPLTVGVKGPKRIHEILTLGTSATREGAVEKKHHCQALPSPLKERLSRDKQNVFAWKNMRVMSWSAFTASLTHDNVI